ncbi:MAG: YbjQ family protein [Acidobacteria bacterium]|nr:MAG: YbjQ family protein [Acidobacteriota bacterium]
MPGYRVVRSMGLVRGNTIRTRHVGKDILAVLRGLVGGEVSEYTKLFAESREQAIDRMTEDAEALGANGIIGVRFATSMVMASAAELLAYGTAVRVEEEEVTEPPGAAAT